MVQSTLANFGLHVYHIKLNIRNEERVVYVQLYVQFYMCIFLYVICSKNIVIKTGKNVYEKEFIN